MSPHVRSRRSNSPPVAGLGSAIEVMREVGVDLTTHHSKSVQTMDAASVGIVITLCAEAVYPVLSGQARCLHWPSRIQ